MVIVFLIIILAILVLGLSFFLFVYFKTVSFHKSMFNKRFDLDPRIKYYTKEEFNLNTTKIEINSNGKKIVGYLYFNDNYNKDKIIVFCHGMYSSKEAYMQDIGYIANKGYLVLGFDYLGTNESEGTLLGFGNSLKSTDEIIKYIKSNDELKNKEIYVVGHSWGGYAAGNIVKLHNDIKGTVLLAPITSVEEIAKSMSPKRIHKFLPIYLNYDNRQTGGYSKYDVVDSLRDYSGNILVIQSKIDPVIPSNISIDRIRELLPNKDNIKYLEPKNRLHNPEYTEEASNYFMEFQKNSKGLTEDELTKYMETCNFHKMGELDKNIMDEICKVFE